MSLLTKSISFCDKVAQNIVDESYKQFVLDTVQNYGAAVIQRHYERWDGNHSVEKIQKTPYLVCQRSNGNPYYMFLCRYNSKNVSIFIDKKIQSGYSLPRMIIVPFQFHSTLYNGTLFDGEMVKTTIGEWVFVINTVLAIKGHSCSETNMVGRLDIIHNIFDIQFKPTLLDMCVFQIKKYFKCTELSDLLHHLLPALNYSSRGLLFKPLYNKFKDILYNFDDSLVKNPTKTKLSNSNGFLTYEDLADLKASTACKQEAVVGSRHAGKLRMLQGGAVDCYKLVDNAGKSTGYLRVRDWKDSLQIQEAFKGQPITKEIPINCEWDAKFQKHEFRGMC